MFINLPAVKGSKLLAIKEKHKRYKSGIKCRTQPKFSPKFGQCTVVKVLKEDAPSNFCSHLPDGWVSIIIKELESGSKIKPETPSPHCAHAFTKKQYSASCKLAKVLFLRGMQTPPWAGYCAFSLGEKNCSGWEEKSLQLPVVIINTLFWFGNVQMGSRCLTCNSVARRRCTREIRNPGRQGQ